MFFLKKKGHQQRTSNRNLQIMPSEDEDEEDDEDEDEAIYSSENTDQESTPNAKTKKYTKHKAVIAKPKFTIPLPSDEEDNTGKHPLFFLHMLCTP